MAVHMAYLDCTAYALVCACAAAMITCVSHEFTAGIRTEVPPSTARYAKLYKHKAMKGELIKAITSSKSGLCDIIHGLSKEAHEMSHC